MANQFSGITVISGSSRNSIGGTTATAGTALGNVISGNFQNGIVMRGAGSENKILGNIIGLNALGSAELANRFQGIELESTHAASIGGTQAGSRNIICRKV